MKKLSKILSIFMLSSCLLTCGASCSGTVKTHDEKEFFTEQTEPECPECPERKCPKCPDCPAPDSDCDEEFGGTDDDGHLVPRAPKTRVPEDKLPRKRLPLPPHRIKPNL